jgi:WD40 repeat protein
LFPNVPRDLEVICLKCLQKEPARRYASALALAGDLLGFQQGKPIRARPVSRLERMRKWARRRPAVAALTLAVLGLVLLVTVAAPLVALREARLRSDAEARATDARAAQTSEAKLRRDAEQLSLRLTLEKGWSLPEKGQVAEGMLWLVRCLEVAPSDDADLQQAIRANLAVWYGYFHPLRAQLPHGAEIAALAFSPDGKCIATGGLDKTVRIWDTKTGQPIGSPLLHEEAIQRVAFRGDGKRLVVATVTPVVYTWDTTTRKLAGEPLKNATWAAGMRGVSLSPDGSHMLVLSTGQTSRLWETESGKAAGVPLQLKDFQDAIAAFSPDGSKVIFNSLALPSRVQVQEALTARAVGKAIMHPAYVEVVALSPDARWAVVGGQDQTARIWDLIKGEALSPPLRHREVVCSGAFSPDGRSVCTSSMDEVRLWEAPNGRPIGPPLWSGAESVVFSPDGSCIAAGGLDGIARLWRVGRRQPEGEPLQHPLTLLAVAFSPDGRRAATACWDGNFLEWDLANRQPVGKSVHKDQAIGMVVTYSPDGRRILTADWQGTTQQWDAVTRQPVGKALRHQGPILDAAYSLDGSKIVTGSGDNTAQLWDAQTGKPLGSPLRHSGGVHSVAFHPDGTHLLTGCRDKTARVWDLRTLQPIGPPLVHPSWVFDAVFSPNGGLILTTTKDGLAQLWDAATGQPIGEPMRHPATIRRAAFSPDGRRVVTASHDGTARIWDVATRRSLGPPLEHPGAVKAVAFSPDGRRILTGDATGKAWLWDAVQPAAEGNLERFKLWVEVSTGQELDADAGRIRVLDFATWDARRRRLAELGGPILPWDR